MPCIMREGKIIKRLVREKERERETERRNCVT